MPNALAVKMKYIALQYTISHAQKFKGLNWNKVIRGTRSSWIYLHDLMLKTLRALMV